MLIRPLNLGELIAKLEVLPKTRKNYKGEDEPQEICFDFASARPTGVDSYRGYYDQLAISYDDEFGTPLEEFIKTLKYAVGRSFQGYKGGYFTMNEQTNLWVANYGKTTNTRIVNVRDGGYRVILETATIED